MLVFYLTTILILLFLEPRQADSVRVLKPAEGPYPAILIETICNGTLEIRCYDWEYSIIYINSANYGRSDRNTCRVPTRVQPIGEEDNNVPQLSNENCQSETASKRVKALCEGSSYCNVKTSDKRLGDDCSHVNRYLEVSYSCS